MRNPKGKWTDSDGREANFTKWDINEPNNMNEQDFTAFWYPGARWTTKIPKAWDDLGGHEKVSIFCDVSTVCDLGEFDHLQRGRKYAAVYLKKTYRHSCGKRENSQAIAQINLAKFLVQFTELRIFSNGILNDNFAI